MKDFKCRCSAIGKIMTAPRAKSETLSETCKTYLKEWVVEQLFNRKKEFSNKYTEKGLIVEDNSIDFIGEQLKIGFLFKNEKYFENDFICGTPDVILENLVIDVKNSWDIFTFPYFETEIPNKDYYWQAQGYMALTNKSKFKLVYVLSDTPDNLIERECYSYCNKNGIEYDVDVFNEFAKKMTYSDIKNEMKIKIFEIERNDADIQAIFEKVNECRVFTKELIKNK